MRRGHGLLDDASLKAAAERYGTYAVPPLSYGTVRDYCDSCDHLRPLATANGDLKDLQRPWMLKAVLSLVGARPSRLLEIGAGEPLVAELLRRLGHEVWVVDPYDGSGNGPRQFAKFHRDYAHLTFVRERFDEATSALRPGYFDCIYSISVLEHIHERDLLRVMAGLRRFLVDDGVTVHAVDHVLRGRGAQEHYARLRLMTLCLGGSEKGLERTMAQMSDDIETYYLSAESHNRWRADLPYDDFPMRVCVSVQLRCPASDIAVRQDLLGL